jgi:hypothetical protein
MLIWTVTEIQIDLLSISFHQTLLHFLQPADMGMIASLKIGYKALMLRTLLSICDDPFLYTVAIEAGRTARQGCKGLSCCAKAHQLDAMEIMLQIWDGEGKYAQFNGAGVKLDY